MAALTILVFVVLVNPLRAITTNKECTKREYHLNHTTYGCGWWFAEQCDRYQAVLSLTHVCCEGYVEHNNGQTCSPVCDHPCLNGGMCIGPQQCACKEGYAQPACDDIDECETESSLCPSGYNCTNTLGSYICSPILEDPCSDIGCSANARCVKHGDMVSCQCNQGYRGDGHVCTKIQCGTLHSVKNGNFTVNGDYAYESNITFRCDDSYSLVGAEHIVCEFSGHWNSAPPRCLQLCTSVHCGANAYCLHLGSFDRCVCQVGYHGDGHACQVTTCPMLLSPTQGFIEHNEGNNFKNAVHFSCDPGYKLKGDSILTCQANGIWTGTVPTCTNPCSDMNCTSGSICVEARDGNTCRCKDGYIGDGSQCRLVVCPDVPAPTHGHKDESSGHQYGSSITFSCEKGYNLTSRAVFTCDINGTWGGETPAACEPIVCQPSSLPKPSNGDAQQSAVSTFPMRVTFSCNSGYRLVGEEQVICGADGVWSHSPPTCQLIICPFIEDIRYGSISTTGNHLGDTAAFGCNTGYNLTGDSFVVCSNQEVWNGTLPFCNPQADTEWECNSAELTRGLVDGPSNLTCNSSQGVLSSQQVCSFACPGNTTYQPHQYNSYRCGVVGESPGWQVAIPGGYRRMEVGRCVEPIFPVMTMTIIGLTAEVDLASHDADMIDCFKRRLLQAEVCGGRCQIANVQISHIESRKRATQQLVAILFTISQSVDDSFVVDLESARVEWTRISTLFRADVDMLHEVILLGIMSLCDGEKNYTLNDPKDIEGPPTLDCPSGHVLKDPYCYPCPEGTFYDRDRGQCEPCPTGFYQPQTAQGRCVKCPEGTTTDKDGTLSKDKCRAYADCNCGPHPCVLTTMGYRCDCPDGYRLQVDQRSCTDIDECSGAPTCSGNGKCYNIPGSYLCLCNEGFAGPECEDVNECHYPYLCPLDSTCENTYGSYFCTCDHGYRLSDGKCMDIDECVEDAASCPPRQTCVNSVGSFRCEE